jgi:hypothetical protein
MRRLLAMAVLSFSAVSAAAGTIDSISPPRIAANSGEHFLTVSGWSLNGALDTIVVFAGPAGTFESHRSSWNDRNVTVYVPNEVGRAAGTYDLTVVAVNESGNTTTGPAQFLVDGVPAGPPRIQLPNDVTVEATQSSGAYAFYNVYAQSSADGFANLECLPKTGSVFPIGETTVQCTAQDSVGTTTGSFHVIVRDTRPPTLQMPTDYVTAFPVVNYEASAFDIVDGPLPATCTPAPGSTFPQGQSIVSCSAQDAHGNRAQGTFRVTVDAQQAASAIESLDPPVIRAASGEWFLTVTGLNLNGGWSTELTFSGPAGNYTVKRSSYTERTVSAWIPQAVVNTPGRYQLMITAIDLLGCCTDQYRTRDIGPVDFWVLNDAEEPAPTLQVPADFAIEAQGAGGAMVRFEVSSNAAVTCTPASGSLFPIGITRVDCVATNTKGSVSASFHVTVADTTPPMLHLPPDITSTEPVVTYEATATDLVDGALTPLCTPPSGSTFETGTTVVACEAVDSHGNRARGEFHVTVEGDVTPPVILSVRPSEALLWPPNHQLVPVVVTVEAFDPDGGPVDKRIVNVTSNQPVDEKDGFDWRITGPLTLELRAERDDGDRIYTIEVDVVDAHGNAARGTCEVRVPHHPAFRAMGH